MAGGGPRVGVLGGGQLGRMLGLAGIPLGISFAFLDPGEAAPAAAVGDLVAGALDDVGAARQVARGAAVVTYEWEGVPAATVEALAAGVAVHPSPAALSASQDRLAEKQAFARLGIATAPFFDVASRADLDAALDALGVPAILKTRRGGYDGKGQWLLGNRADTEAAWDELAGRPALLEGFVAFERELSILACRDRDGTTKCWPLVENRHRDGILRRSDAPAITTPALEREAQRIATALLESFGYVGVLCIELFDSGGTLAANEFAPRVHNSGHWTIEGAITSQFENHLRAVLGWPLGSTGAVGASTMLNCIGALPDRAAVLRVDGAHLHDYGKQPRPGRKVGHVTVTAADRATCDERVACLLSAAPELA